MVKSIALILLMIIIIILQICILCKDAQRKKFDKKQNKNICDCETTQKYKQTLDEQMKSYDERLKEVFDCYYRRNTEGNEDPLEICVLHDSKRLLDNTFAVINNLQIENDFLKKENMELKNK